MRADVPRVALRTLGCKVNRAETESLAEALQPLGVAIAAEGDRPEAIVINTCTVTAEADAKARKEVRRALGSTSGPVIVTGCLAALDADGLHALGSRVVVSTDRESLAAAIATLLGARDSGRGTDAAASAPPRRGGGTFRTRALVKVQDGCDNRCAYCIVPDARGLPRSVPAHEVVRRVEALHAAGVAEVVLTGVNLGRYTGGKTAPDLAALLERLVATGISRTRLSSIEPPDLTDRLLTALADAGNVAPHLHVPLQSGSDRVLLAMGRRYRTDEYARSIARAREAIPGLAVTTDVIAGFPGETDRDAAETLSFAASCRFAKMHVFRYSRRAGTPAASAPGQVPAASIAARAHELRELSASLEREYALAQAGRRADLLVERVEDEIAHGTTGDHLRIAAIVPGARPGDLVPVQLSLSDDGDVRGYYVGESRG